MNHNHYAGLMEVLTPFLLVLAEIRFNYGKRKINVAVMAAVMVGTILRRGSGGGMLAFTTAG